MEGLAQLDAMIAGLRSLDAARDTAREAAPGVLRAVQASAQGGTTPEGRKWKPKKDGGQPLTGASGAISVAVSGGRIVLTIPAPYVWHHFGTKGVPQRQILPDTAKDTPRAVEDAVRSAFVRVMGRSLGVGP